jgi:hypothetical protein
MFETYDTEVEIDGQKYTLKPVSGRYLGKLMNVVRKFQGKSDSNIIESLDEEAVANLYEVSLETFKKSYPSEDVAKLEAFVTQNLFKLIEGVMKVNIKSS